MHYRLDELGKLAGELGLDAHRVDGDRLDVRVADAVLAFCNLEHDDSLVGFDGTPWHSHDVVQFESGNGTYIECDELDVLLGLAAGELVIVSQLVAGELRDRWIAHANEPLDLKHMWRGEELRVQRLPDKKSRD
jgi:hypothetical protein